MDSWRLPWDTILSLTVQWSELVTWLYLAARKVGKYSLHSGGHMPSLKFCFCGRWGGWRLVENSHLCPGKFVWWLTMLNQLCPFHSGWWGPLWVTSPSLSIAMSCPPSLVYNPCERGCPRHCDGNVSSCGDHPSEGCFCPPNKVMLEGSCVPEEACTQCIGEDGVQHQVGAWAFHLPWGCFPLGLKGRSVHQWLASSNCGSRVDSYGDH